MKRDSEGNIIIPGKVALALAGALVSGGGLGAYGVNSANSTNMRTIEIQLDAMRHDMCELRNDFLVSQKQPPRNCK